MKKTCGILLYFIFLNGSFASDAAQAVTAILDVVIDKHIDSSQLELGGGLALIDSAVKPEYHMAAYSMFLNRYKAGMSVDIPRGDENTADLNFGVILGIKQFNSTFGRHFYNLTTGLSLYKHTKGLYIEPSITFILKESSPIRYFFITHTIGLNATISYRHIFIENNENSLLNNDIVSLKFNVFLGQRLRKY